MVAALHGEHERCRKEEHQKQELEASAGVERLHLGLELLREALPLGVSDAQGSQASWGTQAVLARETSAARAAGHRQERDDDAVIAACGARREDEAAVRVGALVRLVERGVCRRSLRPMLSG